MDKMTPYLPYLAYILGAVVGVLYPYWRKWAEDGVAFDWRKVAGKIVAALGGLLILPTLGDLITQIGSASWLIAFGMGIAATFVGHEAQQTPEALREMRGGGG